MQITFIGNSFQSCFSDSLISQLDKNELDGFSVILFVFCSKVSCRLPHMQMDRNDFKFMLPVQGFLPAGSLMDMNGLKFHITCPEFSTGSLTDG